MLNYEMRTCLTAIVVVFDENLVEYLKIYQFKALFRKHASTKKAYVVISTYN